MKLRYAGAFRESHDYPRRGSAEILPGDTPAAFPGHYHLARPDEKLPGGAQKHLQLQTVPGSKPEIILSHRNHRAVGRRAYLHHRNSPLQESPQTVWRSQRESLAVQPPGFTAGNLLKRNDHPCGGAKQYSQLVYLHFPSSFQSKSGTTKKARPALKLLCTIMLELPAAIRYNIIERNKGRKHFHG